MVDVLTVYSPKLRESLEGLREVRDSGSNLTKTLKQQDGYSLCDLDFYQQWSGEENTEFSNEWGLDEITFHKPLAECHEYLGVPAVLVIIMMYYPVLFDSCAC